jgi:hypothetical protein
VPKLIIDLETLFVFVAHRIQPLIVAVTLQVSEVKVFGFFIDY